jgi:hypothetical protein
MVWTGDRNEDGYGKVWYDGRTQLIHRVVYRLLIGPIPDGLTLDHTCSNRPCCRPEHLDPVTQAVNVARAQRRARGWST